jgi:hypothetical protein
VARAALVRRVASAEGGKEMMGQWERWKAWKSGRRCVVTDWCGRVVANKGCGGWEGVGGPAGGGGLARGDSGYEPPTRQTFVHTPFTYPDSLLVQKSKYMGISVYKI